MHPVLRLLYVPAALALAGVAPAAELPVVYNGVTQAPAPAPKEVQPADAKVQLPVIVNYPSAAGVKYPERPANAPPAPARAYAYRTFTDGYVAPSYYNAYAPLLGYGAGYNMAAPYGAFGYDYGAYGYGGFGGLGYGLGYYGGYTAPSLAYAVMPGALVDLRPPLVEVLATGVRANINGVTSMPVAAPVYNDMIGVVYYR
jgi:hypothetical protein